MECVECYGSNDIPMEEFEDYLMKKGYSKAYVKMLKYRFPEYVSVDEDKGVVHINQVQIDARFQVPLYVKLLEFIEDVYLRVRGDDIVELKSLRESIMKSEGYFSSEEKEKLKRYIYYVIPVLERKGLLFERVGRGKYKYKGFNGGDLE